MGREGIVQPGLWSLERSLQAWNFCKKAPRTIDDSQLRQRLWILFYDMALNDQEMMGFVIEKGYTISLRM